VRLYGCDNAKAAGNAEGCSSVRIQSLSRFCVATTCLINLPTTKTNSCGAEPEKGLAARPSNCTQGAKSPLFWLQKERNNMFEGYYSPPLYQDLYNFVQGAQNDIFVDAVVTTPLPSSTHTPAALENTPAIVDAVKPTTPVPTTSPSPSPSSPSSPNEKSPSPAPTSEPKPSQGPDSHHHKHKHTPCSSEPT